MKAAGFALLALMLVVAGCGDRGGAGGPSGGGDSPLRDHTFLSTGITENGSPHQLAGQTRVRMRFTGDDRLIADAGCNSMQGSVRVDGGRIEVSDLASTGMGCEQQVMEQDAWLSRILSSKPSWKLDRDTLTISSPTTEIVLKDRKVVEPDLPLQGPKWTVDTIIDGEVASSTPANASAWLMFDKDAVQVSAGCNSGSGTYSVSGNTLRINDVATTRMACEPDVMSLENAVLAVLRGDLTYSIDADMLTLKQAGKGLRLRGQRS
jgi:heat shock protein HslJ